MAPPTEVGVPAFAGVGGSFSTTGCSEIVFANIDDSSLWGITGEIEWRTLLNEALQHLTIVGGGNARREHQWKADYCEVGKQFLHGVSFGEWPMCLRHNEQRTSS
jgi:hypothetical protein